MAITVFIIIWIAFGVIAYGILFGDAQAQYPEARRENMGMAAFISLGGPIGFLTALFCSGFIQHGFRWR